MALPEQGSHKVAQITVAHITTADTSIRYLLLNQLRYLQQAGYGVTAISSPGPEMPFVVDAGIRHLSIPINRRIAPWDDVLSFVRLYSLLKREKFTIVHTHTPKASVLGQLAARAAGTPIVVNTYHGLYIHDRMHPLLRLFVLSLEKISARCSDLVLSQNLEDMGLAIRSGICRADKIRHLGNGIDLSMFDPDRIPDGETKWMRTELNISLDAPVIGFVGRLAGRRKGFIDFMRMAKEIAEELPSARFLIVGEADRGRRDAVEPGIASNFQIADRCLFLGQRPNAELPLLYSVMNVLVLPSVFEGLPRALMEATAMRVPVVATDVKGNREAVVDQLNGTLVPLGDTTALLKATRELIHDKDRALVFGRHGRELALSKFDERRVFGIVLSEYSRLLEAKGLVSRQSNRLA